MLSLLCIHDSVPIPPIQQYIASNLFHVVKQGGSKKYFWNLEYVAEIKLASDNLSVSSAPACLPFAFPRLDESSSQLGPSHATPWVRSYLQYPVITTSTKPNGRACGY